MTAAPTGIIDDPFGPALVPGALYIGPTLQQRIDLIEHLLEFGRQLIVLSGRAGGGKTTLLHAINAAAGQRWHCVSLQGGPALSARSLLSQVADQLDVDLAADSEPRMAQTMLRLRLNVLERTGKLVVLLVDDADKLPPDAIAALVALARTEDQTAEARVLMSADHDHAGLITGLQRDRPQHGLVHVVEIPPLSEAQAESFLAQRLAAIDANLEDYFSTPELQAIIGGADGNPARLVALARQHAAAKSAGAPRRRATSKSGRGGYRTPSFRFPSLRKGALRWVLPVLALSLTLAVWWLLHDAPAGPPTAAVPVDLPPPPQPDRLAESAEPTKEALKDSRPAEVDPRLADSGEDDLIEITLPDEPAPPEMPSAGVVEQVQPSPTVDPVVTEPSPERSVAAADTRPPTRASEQVAPISAPAPVPDSKPPTAEPVASPAPKPEKVTPARQVPAQTTAKTTAKHQPPVKVKPIEVKPPSPAVAPITPRVNGYSAEWLLKQPHSTYALQLAGVSDRAAASRFIARHGLLGQAAIIDSRRNGKPWFVLVYGYYPNKQAAQAAASRLTPALRKEVAPWARAVGELKALAH